VRGHKVDEGDLSCRGAGCEVDEGPNRARER
jgi:hypothetical protein